MLEGNGRANYTELIRLHIQTLPNKSGSKKTLQCELELNSSENATCGMQPMWYLEEEGYGFKCLP